MSMGVMSWLSLSNVLLVIIYYITGYSNLITVVSRAYQMMFLAVTWHCQAQCMFVKQSCAQLAMMQRETRLATWHDEDDLGSSVSYSMFLCRHPANHSPHKEHINSKAQTNKKMEALFGLLMTVHTLTI